MTRTTLALVLLTSLPLAASAQQEGPVPTQTIVRVEAKNGAPIPPNVLTLDVNNKKTPVTSLTPLAASGVQIALLIDDGLRTSVARELNTLRSFITGLPQGSEIFVGYMQNGRVVANQTFTTNLASAAASLRIPFGSPGISASPYFCVSDFVKNWPAESERYGAAPTASGRKARFVLMLTNGVDPYNGSVSPLNQNSPYVDAATSDAQRAGIPIYSIYFGDAGIRGGAANFSGQSYLNQIAERTGGESLYQGQFNPVSLQPYLKQFQQAVADSYVASFQTPFRKDLVNLRVKSDDKNVKVHAPQSILPGTTLEGAGVTGGQP